MIKLNGIIAKNEIYLTLYAFHSSLTTSKNEMAWAAASIPMNTTKNLFMMIEFCELK